MLLQVVRSNPNWRINAMAKAKRVKLSGMPPMTVEQLEDAMLNFFAPHATGFRIRECRTDEDRREVMDYLHALQPWLGEPMPKDFSAEDQFRARGMGIKLD
jgi:hypothetical protein